jgi:P3 major capsid protein
MRRRTRDLMTGAMSFERVDAFKGRERPHNFFRKRFKAGDGSGGYTAQMNAQAEQAVLALSQPMIQPLAPITFAAANSAIGSVSNIVLNNVGLNTKLIVEVTGRIKQAAAEILTSTKLGMANFFSNITLTDLNNFQRINTTGWHLYLLAAYRNRQPFGAAFPNDAYTQMGSTYMVQDAPNAVGAVAATTNFRLFVEIPIAHHDTDLRGAIYAAVTSAQWRLQLTVNPTLVVGSGVTDSTLAAYQSSTAGNVGILDNVTIQVYQCYLDQLPRSNGLPVLPAMSLSWNYLLTASSVTGMAAALDFPVFYPNFRTFLSTIVGYDNGGQLNAGTDLNYLAIQVANMTYLTKIDPFYTQLMTRNMIGTDFPAGFYLFDHRRKPIDTNTYGNTSFVINPSVVNAGAVLLTAYEMLAIQSQAINAGSLPGG